MSSGEELRGLGEEARSRARLERYRLALAASGINVWEWDAVSDMISTEDHTLSTLYGFSERPPQPLSQWFAAAHPEDRDRVRKAWSAIVEGEADTAELECRVVSDDGKVWWHHTHCLVSAREDGRVRRIIGVSADITERKQAEEARRASEKALRENYERYELTTRSGRVSVAEWDADTDALSPDDRTVVSLVGLDPQERRKGREWIDLIHPADRTQVKAVWSSVANGTVGSSEVEFRMVPDDDQVVWLHSRFMVKEREGDRVRRIISISTDITERKHAEEEIERLANRLLQAQDEERRRIAQELHDQTAQALVASNLNLVQYLHSHPDPDPQGSVRLRESLALSEQALQEIRTLSYVLHPPLLEELGLESALAWFVDGVRRRSGIAVELHVPQGLSRLPLEVETSLYRVVQESLQNILLHSGSTWASIRLTRNDSLIILEVEDHGRGIEAATRDASAYVRAQGVGIANMRQRLRQLGGHLDIHSRPTGTKIRAIVPWEGTLDEGAGGPGQGRSRDSEARGEEGL